MKIRPHIKENLIKNFLIILTAVFCFPFFSDKLGGVEGGQMNNFLLILSILLVSVSFANFAFTYEKTKMLKSPQRWLSHVATFVFMLLFALLLESMIIVVRQVYPSLSGIIIVFSGLLYLGLVLYDFWDLERNSDNF